MSDDLPLNLDRTTRAALWTRLAAEMERYAAGVGAAPVSPELDPEALRARLAPLDFTAPMAPLEALDLAVEGLWRHQVHTPHPRYFGLFNPAPTAMGIAADALVASFNPQLAAWSHNPFANEIERHLVRAFGAKFGYDPESTDGTFASGGAEANHTALLAALAARFPGFAEEGVRALPGRPLLYVSSEAHHSFLKAARACGLGTGAVRSISADSALRMNVPALASCIAQDRAAGGLPFFVAATAGTTSAGAIDPIPALAEVTASERLWLHVDAAWGGAAAIVPELRPLIAGIERADSITFDAHKWLSVPMGAGVFLTRHPDVLDLAFGTGTDYMPREAAGMAIKDPYAHSLQWSRRFTGLKVFLSLLVAGWDGYAAAIRHQTSMGDLLRSGLRASGWEVVHPSPLPIACFVDGVRPEGREFAHLEAVCREVLRSGKAWISTARVGVERTPVLRACITNYRTGPEDVEALIAALGEARRTVSGT